MKPLLLPKNVKFPDGWYLTHNQNHWSNEETMLDYVEHIILPYVKKTQQELGLSSTYPALVLFDSFKGQCIFQKLDENNILYIIVPPNTADKLQPLDLSVNKPTKDFVKEHFQSWYVGIICRTRSKSQ